jgi:hypothetical protein
VKQNNVYTEAQLQQLQQRFETLLSCQILDTQNPATGDITSSEAMDLTFLNLHTQQDE